MHDIHALYHSALAQLERVCTCIIIRIYIHELAHARPPMSSVSLVIGAMSPLNVPHYWGEPLLWSPVYIYVRTFWSPGGPALRVNVKPA